MTGMTKTHRMPFAELNTERLCVHVPTEQKGALKVAQALIDNGELKACPFCGCDTPNIQNTHTPCFSISCPECNAEIHPDLTRSTRRSFSKALLAARDAWNRRVR